MFPGPDPSLTKSTYLRNEGSKISNPQTAHPLLPWASAGRNLVHGVNSQKYLMDQRKLLSCQNQSCLLVVLDYTLARAIKQPIRAAPKNRTWARVVGLLFLQPQSPVHWRAQSHHSSLMPAAWIHAWILESGSIKSYSQSLHSSAMKQAACPLSAHSKWKILSTYPLMIHIYPWHGHMSEKKAKRYLAVNTWAGRFEFTQENQEETAA